MKGESDQLKLDLWNEVKDFAKENHLLENFLEELTQQLSQPKSKEKGEKSEMKSIENLPDGIYQVVDFSANGVYLQDTKTNTVWETKISSEIEEQIESDAILRIEDGQAYYEPEMTEDFLEHLISAGELQKIKEEFAQKSAILEIPESTIYRIEERNQENTILNYQENQKLEVPNALIPYFAENGDRVIYQDGMFHRT